jgi:hypothetical protein
LIATLPSSSSSASLASSAGGDRFRC